ncbi:MAG: metallophosphoesterase, partial [Aquincola sp.]|nr:metallophosphoesterase [Aquincola sp.]
MRQIGLLAATCAASLFAAGCQGGSGAAPIAILAVGDIAQCGGRPAADSAAATTATVVEAQAPDMPLLLLGDLVYASGTLAEYQNCYEPTYGRFMARSFPAPGNHDYGVPGGADYYTYFGARA